MAGIPDLLCPSCGKISPPTAKNCTCGYQFAYIKPVPPSDQRIRQALAQHQWPPQANVAQPIAPATPNQNSVMMGCLSGAVATAVIMIVSYSSCRETPTNPLPPETNFPDARIPPVPSAPPAPADDLPTLELLDGYPENHGAGNFHVVGEVQNNSPHTLRYAEIDFILYDSSGDQIGTAMANITDLEAGGTWKFDAIELASGYVSSYKLKDLSGW